jgi:hypothetical protein
MDSTFGTNGFFTHPLNQSTAFSYAGKTLLDVNGKLLVGGVSEIGNKGYVLARFDFQFTGIYDISETASEEIRLHPNPASSVINISFHDPIFEEVEFCWIDMLGRMLGSGRTQPAISGNTIISINFPVAVQGVCFLKIITAEKTWTRKVMISSH